MMWIDPNDELPEGLEYILFVDKQNQVWMGDYESSWKVFRDFINKTSYHSARHVNVADVVAWMPVPEYKKDNDVD